jgi:membrane protein required for colicin V production
MPITILDLVLLGVMLISGLLAMVRGFMREILSIAAWGAAALVTLYAFSKLLPTAKTYFGSDTIAAVVVVAGTFIGTLIVVSVITVRISDMILDSRIGALDRTLGFLFGSWWSRSCSSAGWSRTSSGRTGSPTRSPEPCWMEPGNG